MVTVVHRRDGVIGPELNYGGRVGDCAPPRTALEEIHEAAAIAHKL